MRSVRDNAHDTIQILNARKLGKATGAELNKLSRYRDSLDCQCCKDDDQEVFFFGVFHYLHFLGTRIASRAFQRELLDKTFFKHIIDHEMQYEVNFITEPFEREGHNNSIPD